MKVKIGETEHEATVTPIYITADKTYSKQVAIFYINGEEYVAFISKGGKLVVNKPQK